MRRRCRVSLLPKLANLSESIVNKPVFLNSGVVPLEGAVAWIEMTFSRLAIALFFALVFSILLFVLRLITRHDWVAMVAFAVVMTSPTFLASGTSWIALPFMFAFYSMFVFLLMRFGLVGLWSALWVSD